MQLGLGNRSVTIMLKLYYAKASVAIASLVALEEAGADYEAIELDFANRQQRTPEYLGVNPKGRVPALVTDRGIITETPAILVYVAQTHPDAGLAPMDDAYAFAQMQSFNGYMCSTVHVAHAHKMRGRRWADDEAALEAMKKKVPETMAECFSLIETELLRGPWVMGEQFTICDPYLFAVSSWLEADGVDPAGFPAVLDHRNRMRGRASVQRALSL